MPAHDSAPRASFASHLRLWPALRTRPRLLAAIVVGLVVDEALRFLPPIGASARALVGWNAGALLYLVFAWLQMRGVDDAQRIQSRAVTQDEGRMTILVLVVLASAAVMLAVGTQLAQVKDMDAGEPGRAWRLALAGGTVVTSWLFTQVLFAVHYAHDFYLARHHGRPDPLEFPGTRDPGYADFFYFSCIIGTSAQTADVPFHGRGLRPVGTLHCVLSFFFNATLLALSINVAAGLLQ